MLCDVKVMWNNTSGDNLLNETVTATTDIDLLVDYKNQLDASFNYDD